MGARISHFPRLLDIQKDFFCGYNSHALVLETMKIGKKRAHKADHFCANSARLVGMFTH